MATAEQVREAYHASGGNISETARRVGITRSTVRYHLDKLGTLSSRPEFLGRVGIAPPVKRALPPPGEVRRYILSSAQNNTRVNTRVMDSLETLASHYGAEVMISRFAYNTTNVNRKDVKPGSLEDPIDELWYDPRILGHINDEQIELAPGLVWCGEMNISPTASRPLSGFETYTGRASGIFPHVKVALESIASHKDDPTKFNYTTGTVTERNYIQRKAGLRAEHHHCYGALLAEVDSEGRWWCRQLNATEDGEIWDLDIRVRGSRLTTNNRVKAVTWGDVHAAQADPTVVQINWGESDSIVDTLMPEVQFLHDIFDMRARNHHDRGNPHKAFYRYVHGGDSVAEELMVTRLLLGKIGRGWCRTVVVNSNHDNALERWLREGDYRSDPVNAELFLTLQLHKYQQIRNGSGIGVLERGLQICGLEPEDVLFLGEDESYVICDDAHGGIERGMHGHLGINGAKASPLGLSKMGRKAITAHTHSAAIIDGIYVAGTSSKLDVGYNSGPSSWSHSHVVTYPTGKRAIVTVRDGSWRA